MNELRRISPTLPAELYRLLSRQVVSDAKPEYDDSVLLGRIAVLEEAKNEMVPRTALEALRDAFEKRLARLEELVARPIPMELQDHPFDTALSEVSPGNTPRMIEGSPSSASVVPDVKVADWLVAIKPGFVGREGEAYVVNPKFKKIVVLALNPQKQVKVITTSNSTTQTKVAVFNRVRVKETKYTAFYVDLSTFYNDEFPVAVCFTENPRNLRVCFKVVVKLSNDIQTTCSNAAALALSFVYDLIK